MSDEDPKTSGSAPGDDELETVRRIVRHDLRSPVAVVVGRVDLLLAELAGPLTASQRASLESVLSAADRIDRLVTDLARRIDRLWPPDEPVATPGGAGPARGGEGSSER